MDNYILSCKTTNNISSIVGSVASFATNYIKYKFPPNFFKKIYINTSLNSLNMRNEDIQKYQTPSLYVGIDYGDSDLYNGLNLRGNMANEFIFNNKRKYYNYVLHDPENKVDIFAIENRIKVSVNIKIKVPTVMMSYDIYNYIINNFDIGGFRYANNINIESEIPKNYILPICQRFGWDYKKAEDKDKLNAYLYDNSFGGIRNKINLSSGNPMYSYKNKVNILMGFSDVPNKDKNVKNLIVSDAIIDFPFTLELSVPTNFILEMKNINNEIQIQENENENLLSSTCLYNSYVDTDYVKTLENGLHLINKRQFIPDINVEYDELDVKQIMQSDLLKVCLRIIEAGLPLWNIIKIKVMAGNKFLTEDMFTIDWDNLIVKTNNPMANTTYTLFIYGDLSKLNAVEDKINRNEKIQDISF